MCCSAAPARCSTLQLLQLSASPSMLQPFVADFRARFIALLTGAFRTFKPALALSILSPQLSFSEAETQSSVKEGLPVAKADGEPFSAYDLKRLQVGSPCCMMLELHAQRLVTQGFTQSKPKVGCVRCWLRPKEKMRIHLPTQALVRIVALSPGVQLWLVWLQFSPTAPDSVAAGIRQQFGGPPSHPGPATPPGSGVFLTEVAGIPVACTGCHPAQPRASNEGGVRCRTGAAAACQPSPGAVQQGGSAPAEAGACVCRKYTSQEVGMLHQHGHSQLYPVVCIAHASISQAQ